MFIALALYKFLIIIIIAKLYKNVHKTMLQDLLKRFEVLKKCRKKFDCLVYEILLIRALKPNLNVQSDSIWGKVFSYSSRPLKLILRVKIALNIVICIFFFIFDLDNGGMTTPKRRILSFVFTVLCLKKSLTK